MSQVLEAILSTEPFVVRRTVRWNDCDPAGVVYSGMFATYLLQTVSLFRGHLFGANWAQMKQLHEVDTPAKAMNMVFKGSLWPDQQVDLAAYISELSRRTITCRVVARTPEGEEIFDGSVTSVFIPANDRSRSVEIPPMLRALAEAYLTAFPPPS